jgi:hypothetical protein
LAPRLDLTGTRARKLLTLALPAGVLSVLLAVAAVEIWVRSTWDSRRGTPGFFVADAQLGQRLAAGYDGWFAGVPVKINRLGFRDPREYALEKTPQTIRILVLGDSVTFGHGAVYEATYPYLLEQRLRQWRPELEWQVWNLGVPGYNTSQELAYLNRVGATYRPDLVIVGFFENDLQDAGPLGEPGLRHRTRAAVQHAMQTRLYSYELYKRVFLTIQLSLLGDPAVRRRIEHLGTEEQLLAAGRDVATLPQQQLTPVERFTDEEVKQFVCVGLPAANTADIERLRTDAQNPATDVGRWLQAVRSLQQLHASGAYRIGFFLNMAPDVCEGADRFFDAGALAWSDAIEAYLSRGTPAVSSVREFLHYRPSQMPLADAHSIGNSNAVKADVLFTLVQRMVAN